MKNKIISYSVLFILVAIMGVGLDFYLYPDSGFCSSRYMVVGSFFICLLLLMMVLLEFIRRKTGMKVDSLLNGIWGYAFVLSLGWTLLIFFSLVWNSNRQHNQIIEIASIEASTIYNRDHLYYQWATIHQGVFVPITSINQPSDYLSHLPNYVVKTTDGQMLTLVNPEYLIRQVYELQSMKDGPLGHITSLDPIRPENEADEWESNALKAFENGSTEVSEVQSINNRPYLRLMKPMITDYGCLKCHAAQGYQIGDVRGGISVSVPLTPLHEISDKTIVIYSVVHGILWILGLIGILYGAGSIFRSITRLEEAESNTRAVLENMKDGVITLDTHGSIKSLNAAALAMFGYDIDEVCKKNMGDFLAQSDESSGEHGDNVYFLSECTKGETVSPCRTRELKGRRKDGKCFPLEINTNTMWMGTEHIILVMARDITERKKAQSVLLSSQKQAVRQEKLVSLGTMVAGIAHEIKNPAQAIAFSMEGLHMNVEYIRKFIALVEGYFKDSPSSVDGSKEKLIEDYNELRMDLVLKGVEDVVERNVTSIKRIDRIINSTKRMANSQEVFRPCDINAIVNDAAILTRNHVKYKAQVNLNLGENLPRINGLSQDLGQVFINLILNAMDAIVEKGMTAKQGRINVSSRYDAQKGRVEVTVADNGIGISPDFIGNIFDPFFTTKSVGQGMGLGLNICHRIIEAHGGEILVDSALGKGAIFTVCIDQVAQ
ncbi:MAG: ATP-binding protein [Desulfobulbaceae bacterium]|nr:ATP-binding protein [Desulfobulbaceae bacterium]